MKLNCIHLGLGKTFISAMTENVSCLEKKKSTPHFLSGRPFIFKAIFATFEFNNNSALQITKPYIGTKSICNYIRYTLTSLK